MQTLVRKFHDTWLALKEPVNPLEEKAHTVFFLTICGKYKKVQKHFYCFPFLANCSPGVKGTFSCGFWYLVGGTCIIDIDINCLFALNLLSGPVELLQVNSIEIEQCTMRARELLRVLRESMLKEV